MANKEKKAQATKKASVKETVNKKSEVAKVVKSTTKAKLSEASTKKTSTTKKPTETKKVELPKLEVKQLVKLDKPVKAPVAISKTNLPTPTTSNSISFNDIKAKLIANTNLVAVPKFMQFLAKH